MWVSSILFISARNWTLCILADYVRDITIKNTLISTFMRVLTMLYVRWFIDVDTTWTVTKQSAMWLGCCHFRNCCLYVACISG